MTADGHGSGPWPARPAAAGSTVFREEALAHHADGERAADWAVLRRPPALRWLWLLIAAAAAGAFAVGAQPVPGFLPVDLTLLPACQDGAVLVAAPPDAKPALQPGRRVVLDEGGPAGGLRLTAVEATPQPLDEVAFDLSCAASADGLPGEPHAVALAEPADADSSGPLPQGRRRARIETGQRRFVTLLPLWSAAPAGEAGVAAEGG